MQLLILIPFGGIRKKGKDAWTEGKRDTLWNLISIYTFRGNLSTSMHISLPHASLALPHASKMQRGMGTVHSFATMQRGKEICNDNSIRFISVEMTRAMHVKSGRPITHS